jgi:3-dehydroquinate synthase
MEKIVINTGDSLSGIVIGGRWQAVVKMLPESDVVIITDDNVYDIYGIDFPAFPVITIRPGEGSKTLSTAGRIIDELLKIGADRSCFILGIGGGVVCDLTGFVASIYLRGVRFGFVSTSLLSQVDASVGGKNGVDAGFYKNVIGTFRQPEFVICDTTMLNTLPDKEYLSGLAEMIKVGLIGDASLVEIAEKNHGAIMERDRDLMTDAVARTIKYKASVVAEDEKESGARRVLNFGHTYGHPIEMANNFQHGFAVAAGMELAIHLSFKKGLLDNKNKNRALKLLDQYKIVPKYEISEEKMMELISRDKKKSGNGIHFVLIEDIGKPIIEKISIDELIGFYSTFLKNR